MLSLRRREGFTPTPVRPRRIVSGFTLVELLITFVVIGVLSTILVVAINPAEFLRQGRDGTRFSDLGHLTFSLELLRSSGAVPNLGSANTIYISIPDSSPTCENLGLTPPSGWSFHCATLADYRKTGGNGWIPLNFQATPGGALGSTLPVDPVNTVASGRYYAFVTDGTTYAVTVPVESQKRLADTAVKDGGTDVTRVEKGSNLALWTAATQPPGPGDNTPPDSFFANSAPTNGATVSANPILTVIAATDTTQPVSYYFELFLGSACTVGATQNSGWQAGTSWNPTALLPGTYAWHAKARDSVVTPGPNESAYTSCWTMAVPSPDTTPPAAIANLATSNPTISSVTLSWPAPGNDGNVGTAASYDVRYSTANITELNWSSASLVSGEPVPQIAGTAQNMTVTGLSPGTTYYFAIKTSDAAVPVNVSAISNVVLQPTAISGGLVAQWKFNGDAADATGNHPGTLGTGTGPPSFTTIDGRTAVSFGAQAGSYVSVADDSTLFLGKNITIAVWIKRNTSALQAIYGDFNAGVEYSLELPANADSVLFYSAITGTPLTLGTAGSGSGVTAGAGGSFPWTHIAVTWDATTGVATLYKDGISRDTKAFSNNPTVRSAFPYYIGQRPTSGNKLNGYLDDLRVYNRALNSTEIKAIVNGAP